MTPILDGIRVLDLSQYLAGPHCTLLLSGMGAEVIRMYQTLLGVDGFRKGMDLYFERHDGQAVTCDDFRAAMADANGADLAQFERWYTQAGTPTVVAQGSLDAAKGVYTLTLTQSVSEEVRAPLPRPLTRARCSRPRRWSNG